MTPSADESSPLRDLPPVEPPSAGFIIQLFVIPAIVVAVFIVVYLLFGRLAGGERNAMDYVQKIKSDSGDWRSAFELASLIQNDSKLANDSKLLGELTELLASELRRKEATPQLNRYLALTLGVFQTLDGRTQSGKTVDPIAVLTEALSPTQARDVRAAAAESLARQAARLKGALDNRPAVEALARTAADPEHSPEEPEHAELRQLATYALGFFGGDEALSALRDRAKDDPNRPVRFNAASALARRGDPAAYAVLREMLSPDDVAQVVKSDNRDETLHRVELIEVEALKALETSVQAGHPALAQRLRPEVDRLAKSDLAGVKNEAQVLLKSLPKTP